ncbi:MAG TPA: DUF4127 family protein, partial [Chloroflexaceae bacterium]|nr:DUF4127 family protein [Chloroflexaceae bacterium]
MKIGLLPLDERPANTRYPAMVAAIAGAEVLLPPAVALGAGRRPADRAALGAWLAAMAPELDGLIVSLELLGYGGLIASRTGDEPAVEALTRLELLRQLRRTQPRLPVYGFGVVTRVSNANDAVEEPEYWAEHGERLYALSQLLDRRRRGQAVGDELARLEADVPATHRRDWLRRRLRNHAVNLAALGLLEDGALDLLVLSSDDTSPDGLPSAEKAWLSGWRELLGPQPALLMYPGADEVACALVARMLNERAGAAPTVAARYAPTEAAANVAAYEDGPISVTVERQVLAAGGRAVAGAADLWLGVNAPVARRAEWDPAHAAEERDGRRGALEALVAEARAHMDSPDGPLVAIADVAYPNGADPALIDLMLAGLDLGGLAAYGAWNTAGNTLGTTIAQGFAALLCDSAEGRAAHELLLTHRLVEDWGYQQLVRAEVRAWLRERTGHHDPRTAEEAEAARERVEAGRGAPLAPLPGLGGSQALPPGGVRPPLGRTLGG